MAQNFKYWLDRKPDDPQKDWNYEGSWLEGYEKSVDHPHRKLVVKNLKGMTSVLEVGCSVGPNLTALSRKYPFMELVGIDANKDAVQRAQELLPKAHIQQGNILTLPYRTDAFDAVLADAVLMYIPPHEIIDVLHEIDRVARKRIIIVDRLSHSRTGVDSGYIFYRNYPQLLHELGLKVRSIKITKDTWPGSIAWQHAGYLFVGDRP